MEAVAQGRSGRLDLNSDVVRAAGAVVWRRVNGHVELLLVHRPKYDDWTFPKGKCEDDEPDEDCALREVEEETGLQVLLGPAIAVTEYESRGRPKRVCYWLAVAAGDARAQNEVDEVAWVSPQEARDMLSYGRDLEVLNAALEAIG